MKRGSAKPGPAAVEQPWAASAGSVVAALGVDAESGLAQREVQSRRRRYGPNRLRRLARTSALRILVRQFASTMMALLGAAAALAFAMGHLVDGVAIGVVIAINVAIGFVVELRGTRSMEALHRLVEVSARVRRDGRVDEIRADELVPGDVVLLEGGDVISADLRLIEAANMQADESTLTGESVPVDKSVEPVDAGAQVADRHCMLHSGTALTRGGGEGVVVATGLATELGKISMLVAQTEDESTPLERRLESLGRRLIWVTLALTALIAAMGMAFGRDIEVMISIAIALAVAAVPEGLPVVATIALARGMWRMARRNVLVSRLSAVETLGATGVICTDKTGTLTENRMTVTRIVPASGEEVALEGGRDPPFTRAGEAADPERNGPLGRALETAVLCNNASLDADDAAGGTGDPLEIALLAAGRTAGLGRESVLERFPEVRTEPFDTSTRMMATFHQRDGRFLVAVKGAPEAVLAACSRIDAGEGERELSDEAREHWANENARLAEEGLRVLALARGDVASIDADPYRDLALVGLVGLVDPPRSDVAAAIDECRRAGIRVVMVTGDQPATAGHVARQLRLVPDAASTIVRGRDLGPPEQMAEHERKALLDASIVARVDPAQKLDLIALHQASGMVVAMTGDGVNDAPALRKADIGVAMGRRGTQVAREAADMVLMDDAFGSIVAAVRHGRVIFDNIRKFVLYLMSCNVAEIMVVAIATLANAPLPLLPLQILYLNLITDVFPALALGVGAGDPRVMSRPPRPADEAILTRAHWLAVAGYGTVITAAVLGAFWFALERLGLPVAQAVTVSFAALAFAQLWHAFNMRDRDSTLLRNDVTGNPYVWGAVLLCAALILMAVHLPALAQVLRLESPGPQGWALALGASLVPLVVGQLAKSLLRARGARLSRSSPGGEAPSRDSRSGA